MCKAYIKRSIDIAENTIEQFRKLKLGVKYPKSSSKFTRNSERNRYGYSAERVGRGEDMKRVIGEKTAIEDSWKRLALYWRIEEEDAA